MSLPYLELLEEFFYQHFHSGNYTRPEIKSLLEAILYSLQSGGKRFRPNIIYLMGEALQLDHSRLTPFAAALECIHTYSLIHDDLPCMDNDYWRRNRPTNHIMFGEATALLAGDALLTEAFHILGHYYQNNPQVGLNLVKLLSQAAGSWGMIGGQVLDIKAKLATNTVESLTLVHKLKTGALIKACSEGAACIANSPFQTQIAHFGYLLGFCFQLKDDFLDFDPRNPEPCNLVTCLGQSKARALLEESSREANECLAQVGLLTPKLKALVEFNLERQV